MKYYYNIIFSVILNLIGLSGSVNLINKKHIPKYPSITYNSLVLRPR